MSSALVLASTSPRRRDLLRQAGLRVSIRAPEADETVRPGEAPATLVRRLARDKALSVLRATARRAAIIIAADTIVVSPDGRHILNKPRDKAEAVRMLALLAGRTHTVLTGYCLVTRSSRGASKRVIRVVRSKVRMRKLSRADILGYVASGEPMDKAGAYAAQGLGMALIEEIQGSYTNVVGLPVCQVLQDLENIFGIPTFGRRP